MDKACLRLLRTCRKKNATCRVRAFDGTQATVRHHGRGDFVMFRVGSTTRSRWGTATQICEDIRAFRATGALPGGKDRW